MYTTAPQTLTWDHGPVSFGNLVAGAIVSWSTDSALDLLVSRCWRGAYLYTSTALSDDELIRPPIKVCEDLEYLTRATPLDWNRDGFDDLVLTDRPGFIYLAERTGDYPNITFPKATPLTDYQSGLVFNIPFENPHHPGPDSQGGYLDPDFFCYVYPVAYPMSDDPGHHLILGDAAGNLWWLRDESGGVGEVRYQGLEYEKTGTPMSYGIRYRERFGTTFAKPAHKLCTTDGKAILLGKAFEGYRDEEGGNCKPILLPSENGSDADLLVLTTDQTAHIHYYARNGVTDAGVPTFEQRGMVELSGIDPKSIGFHSPIMLTPYDGGARMILATSSGLAILNKSSGRKGEAPSYEFDHYVSGTDVPAALYGATEILTDDYGSRYLLDNPGSFRMYPLTEQPSENTDDAPVLRVGSEFVEIRDNYGVFEPEGITDVRSAPNWGVHRAVRWRFDARNPDRQDLIVGTDVGHLYLLIADGDDPGRYQRYGPLEDSTGEVIKIHNRVFPAPVDYYQDGREDLLLVGANYQMGIAPDPNAGCGFYVCEHLGMRDGLPRLSRPVPVHFGGFTPPLEVNQNPHMQTIDIDGDGEIEVIIAVKDDGGKGRIYSVAPEGGALDYTGTYIPEFRLHQRILDIDGDGKLERVFAGGETGIGRYEPVEIVKE